MSEPKIQKIPPLTSGEVAQIATSLQSLVGSQLQECVQSESELGLGFYHNREILWLWFDLHPLRPLVLRLKGNKPPARKKVARPLTLFVKSRLVGKRLQAVRSDLALGRVLILEFHPEGEIEARLFPHAANILVRADGKSVSENKPKDLPPLAHPPSLEAGRSWEEIEAQWLALQTSAKAPRAEANSAERLEKEWRRAIEKKEKAIERMREELAEKTSDLNSEIGEWLKTHRTLDVPPEWRERVNAEKSLSWNIEDLFRRSKEGSRKAEGARLRIALVERELASLRAQGPGAVQKIADRKERESRDNLLGRADAKGRRHKIGDDLEVYIGKSAADNLALLRRAQPFDYWLHLRDYPGSHAIMRRARGRLVTDDEFAQAGRWVVEQSLNKRAAELSGERYDLLIVECRFVRPIKGDKLGRVNYTNDRVMSLRM